MGLARRVGRGLGASMAAVGRALNRLYYPGAGAGDGGNRARRRR